MMASYWIDPQQLGRITRHRDGSRTAFHKEGAAFHCTAEEHGEPGQIPVLNADDAHCFADGSVRFWKAWLLTPPPSE